MGLLLSDVDTVDGVFWCCCGVVGISCNNKLSVSTLRLFQFYLQLWERSEISDVTCTITRMIDSEVSSQMAHFSLEHTHVVICGTIRGTHRLFIRRTIIHAYAPRVPGTKCLTNGKVLTGDINARINICNMKCKEFFVLFFSN